MQDSWLISQTHFFLRSVITVWQNSEEMAAAKQHKKDLKHKDKSQHIYNTQPSHAEQSRTNLWAMEADRRLDSHALV